MTRGKLKGGRKEAEREGRGTGSKRIGALPAAQRWVMKPSSSHSFLHVNLQEIALEIDHLPAIQRHKCSSHRLASCVGTLHIPHPS